MKHGDLLCMWLLLSHFQQFESRGICLAASMNDSVFLAMHRALWGPVCWLVASYLMLQVYIDKELAESGSLYDDFDMLAPKTIKVRH